MRHISQHDLLTLAQSALTRNGVPAEPAGMVTASLVRANLLGHDSHGVVRMPQYLQGVRDGAIRVDAVPRMVADGPACTTVDGDWGFGQVVGRYAVKLALEKGRAAGAGVIAVRKSHHLGRIGEWPEQIARAGLVGLAFSNATRERVAPFGGIAARLSPTVIAAAAPRPGCEVPFLLDMSCSVIPEGKVRVALNRGAPLPEGAAIDGEGRPTTDPAAYYGPPEGALLPLGGLAGHKGYGLGLLCEILAGALTGAGTAGEAVEQEGNGLVLMALEPAWFGRRDEFQARVEALFGRMVQTPTAPGVVGVLLPGDLEARIAQERSRDGIPIDDETWRQIAGLKE